MAPTKNAAIAKLQDLIEEAASIQPSTGEHHGWRRTVRLALGHIFGPESTQLHDFNNQLGARSYEVSVLESMIHELRDYWDDASLKSGITDSTSNGLESFWTLIHPRVVNVAEDLFNGGFFADCVLAAFRELNSIVKAEVRTLTGEEYDGATLMNRAFSARNPIIELGDIATEDGKNIQQGYMQMFAGAMMGIRNPKAHGNIDIDRGRAIHFIFVASLLMSKFDERRI